MKPIKVGTYHARFSSLDVYLREGTGGEFFTFPDNSSLPQVVVGAYTHKDWPNVVAVALHEIMEFCLLSNGCRYSPNPDESNDASGYLFVMDHNKFSEASAGAGFIMAFLLPALAQSFKEFHKPKK